MHGDGKITRRLRESPCGSHAGGVAYRVKLPILGRMQAEHRPDSRSLQTLIVQASEGDHAAFSLIYARTHTHLFGVAIRILGQGQAAEDALQEAFVSIWKNVGHYRSEMGGQVIQPMTWLIAIVRNKALDAFRARARRRESAFTEPDDIDDADDLQASSNQAPSAMQLFEQATDSLRIGACMQALDGSHRQSLALAYYQGLSHAEVAAQTGAPLGSVKAWIRRGLDKLRTCLASQGVAA